jgi:hypothetical protein
MGGYAPSVFYFNTAHHCQRLVFFCTHFDSNSWGYIAD